jgi:hypothetical protein
MRLKARDRNTVFLQVLQADLYDGHCERGDEHRDGTSAGRYASLIIRIRMLKEFDGD